MAGFMDTTELPKLPDLQQTMGAPAATPATTPAAATVDPSPVTRTIDPAKETVAGQLNTLTAKESPLMTRARTGAMQTANARGLMNSSIAAGAGEAAAIDSALPIATADANLYGVAARDNMTAQNQFGAAKLQGNIESNLFDKQAAQQTNIQQLQATSAKELANIEATYKTQMQGNATAGQVMAAAQSGINDILKDTTLSNDAKAALVKQLQNGLKAQMGVIGAMSGLDLASLLVFPESALPATAAPPPPPANPAAAPGTVTAATPGAVKGLFGGYYVPQQTGPSWTAR